MFQHKFSSIVALALCGVMFLFSGCHGGGTPDPPPPPPPVTYTVTVSAGLGVASVAPTSSTVNQNASLPIKVTLATGYTEPILSNGSNVTTVKNTDGTYTYTLVVTSSISLTISGTKVPVVVNKTYMQVSPLAMFSDEVATTAITVTCRVGDIVLNSGKNFHVMMGGTELSKVGEGLYSATFLPGNPVLPSFVPLDMYQGKIGKLGLSCAIRDDQGNNFKDENNVEIGMMYDILVVDRSSSINISKISDTVYATPRVINVVHSAYPFDDVSILKEVHKYFQPEAVLVSLEYEKADVTGQFYAIVSNDVAGINLPIFNNSAVYGATKLRGVMHSDPNRHGDPHEAAHSWGMYLNNPALNLTKGDASNAHITVASTLRPGLLSYGWPLGEQSDGSFKALPGETTVTVFNMNKYTTYGLYTMGRLPAGSVGPEWFALGYFDNNQLTVGQIIPRSEMTYVTISDLQRVYGVRVPDIDTSITKIVYIVVTEAPASVAKMAALEIIAKYLGGTAEGDGWHTPMSFNAAAYGLWTVDTTVPARK